MPLKPIGLTIGSFDGVHLGHQQLLKHLKAKVGNGSIAVFTFSDHPSHLFTPDSPTPLICTAEHKKLLLSRYGVETIMMIPFSREFAETPFERFLTELKEKLHFTHLVLGVGACFGKDRKGDESHVIALSEQLQFEVEYLPKLQLGTHPISSGRVRIAIESGNLEEVRLCLGRPYSLYGELIRSKDRFQIDLPGVCLPPEGDYPIQLNGAEGVAHVDRNNSRLILDLASPWTGFGEVVFEK